MLRLAGTARRGADRNDCTADPLGVHPPGGCTAPTSRGLERGAHRRPQRRCASLARGALPATCMRLRLARERGRGLLGRFKPGGPMLQPCHRVRLRADILPALERRIELIAIARATGHDDLPAAVLECAEPRHVQLTGLAHPSRAVDRPVGAYPPPQPDVLLARCPPTAVCAIEVTQRLIAIGSVRERPGQTAHRLLSWNWRGWEGLERLSGSGLTPRQRRSNKL